MKAERTFMGKPNVLMPNVIISKINDWRWDTTDCIQMHQTRAEEQYISRILNSHAKSVHKSSYTVGYCLPVKKCAN